MVASSPIDLSVYEGKGVMAKLKEGQAGYFLVKIFDDKWSFVLYEGYDESEARAAWRLISKIVSE